MVRARISHHQGQQSIQLPKSVELPAAVQSVEVIRLGPGQLLVTEETGWDSWFDAPGVTEDFLMERQQPVPQERQDG
jgi:antitoxin VapB